MNQLFIFLMVLLAAIPLVLLLSLVDRIKKVEAIAQDLINSLSGKDNPAESKRDTGFLGLDGKELWQFLSGSTGLLPGATPEELELLRTKFKPLLEKQIRHLVSSGMNDAKLSKPRTTPRNEKPFNTLRGEVTVSVPGSQAGALYNAGFDFAGSNGESARRIAADMQRTLDEIHTMLGMKASPALLEDLLGTAHLSQDFSS